MNTIAKLSSLFSVVLFSVPFSASTQAAAFDCARAQSAVEKQICADPRLSRVDGELGYAFSHAEEIAEDRYALERTQYRWLRRVRDKCPDTACLAAAYEEQLKVVNAMKKFTWARYKNKELGISFSYPTNFKVELGTSAPVHLTLRERGAPGSANALVLVELWVLPGTLAANAEQEGFFLRGKGASVSGGVAGENVPATKISRNGWYGWKVTTNCAWEDQLGFHGAGDCITALLSNDRMTVSLWTGGPEPRDEAKRLLNSLRILQ